MLDPVPGLEFFGGHHHRYRLKGEWLPYNVSTVLSWDMPAAQRAAIERTKEGPDGWEIRGRTLHRVLERHLLGEPDIVDDRWTPWIEPLLDQPLFKGVEVLAVEYPICDKIKRVGGSLDFLLRRGDSVLLGDLKTVSSKKGVSSRKPATAQLAAYQSMLASLHPRLMITDLVTVVCGPERTRIISSDAETAWQQWEEAWGRFHATQPDF
nr:DNA replication factor Dna2-like nuclease [uncultured Mediterranean phage uvMED]BAR24863.1 DNA replication factor Dna2-like nuclease [uncultured Mediterranean phage uvMED]